MAIVSVATPGLIGKYGYGKSAIVLAIPAGVLAYIVGVGGFLGLGEKAEDLQPFSVDNYVKAVFGLE